MSLIFEEVGDAIYRRRYEFLDQNIGVILGGDGVLVVDTRSVPSHAEEIAAELRAFTPLPVSWVVNTHWHWDHVLGNSIFAGAEIWGHTRCQEVMRDDPEYVRAGASRGLGEGLAAEVATAEIVPPGRTFDRNIDLDIGGRIVHLAYRGLGHTDADLTLAVDDVLFAGDLLEEGAPPAFGDSYPLRWPDTVESHVAEKPRLIVPGHGDVMTAGDAAGQVEELYEVSRRCRAAATEAELDLVGAPYPDDVMKLAFNRARAERG